MRYCGLGGRQGRSLLGDTTEADSSAVTPVALGTWKIVYSHPMPVLVGVLPAPGPRAQEASVHHCSTESVSRPGYVTTFSPAICRLRSLQPLIKRAAPTSPV